MRKFMVVTTVFAGLAVLFAVSMVTSASASSGSDSVAAWDSTDVLTDGPGRPGGPGHPGPRPTGEPGEPREPREPREPGSMPELLSTTGPRCDLLGDRLPTDRHRHGLG